MNKPKIIAVAGPTAVGKTAYAIEIAREFDGEVVSCDSMQLYKYMDIGSAKPTLEEQAMATHHLVDIVDPRDDFSVAKYSLLAQEAISDILNRGKTPVISGGTGLYLNSILYHMDFADAPRDSDYRTYLEKIAEEEGADKLHEMLSSLDPSAASTIHPNNKVKIIRALERLHSGENKIHQFKDVLRERDEYEAVLIGLNRDRQELYDRINMRVNLLMDAGLVEEVRNLMNMGLTADDISMKGIGYKEVIDYLEGNMPLEECIATIKKNTRHYAKRQLTWFKRYDKIKWYNLSEYLNDQEALEDIKRWLKTRL